MIYVVENIDFVDNNFVTINRGDIIGGMNAGLGKIVVLRLQKNQRDF